MIQLSHPFNTKWNEFLKLIRSTRKIGQWGELKKMIKKSKKSFTMSNVCYCTECETCVSWWCIYSHLEVVKQGGPKKQDKRNMINDMQEGYVCGNRTRASHYVMRRQIRCMYQIETQYYNSVTVKQKKRRTISTDPICCLCYD